jgi:transcriptional regulator with XRE-family HTH domain
MKKTCFPERLKELRLEKDIGQEKLAEETGLSHGVISLWENGLRERKLSSLVMLAEYFDVSIDYLVGLED